MIELTVRTRFSAAHHLVDYRGKCSALHGHNWDVMVTVKGDDVGADGMLLDFGVLKKEVRALLEDLDHTDINSLEYFQTVNPTSENIARYIYRRLAATLNNAACRVSRVSVYETPDACASYEEP